MKKPRHTTLIAIAGLACLALGAHVGTRVTEVLAGHALVGPDDGTITLVERAEYDGHYDLLVMAAGCNAVEGGLVLSWTVTSREGVVATGTSSSGKMFIWAMGRKGVRVGRFLAKRGLTYAIDVSTAVMPASVEAAKPTFEVRADPDVWKAHWVSGQLLIRFGAALCALAIVARGLLWAWSSRAKATGRDQGDTRYS